MKTVEYNLCYGKSRADLFAVVGRATGEGWEPTGGIAFDPSFADGKPYMQAMVRKVKYPVTAVPDARPVDGEPTTDQLLEWMQQVGVTATPLPGGTWLARRQDWSGSFQVARRAGGTLRGALVDAWRNEGWHS